MGREFELKYRANPRQQEAIQGKFGPFAAISMETVYYDTPDGRLSRRHITLRRRYEGGRAVCTLKTPEAGHGRGEWELECGDIALAIPELCKLSGWGGLTQWTGDGVIALCGARFTRLYAPVVLPECTVELALDAGILTGGGAEAPLCEVEVELKSGSEAAAAAFAQALAGEFGLTPEPKSKFARARALAET